MSHSEPDRWSYAVSTGLFSHILIDIRNVCNARLRDDDSRIERPRCRGGGCDHFLPLMHASDLNDRVRRYAHYSAFLNLVVASTAQLDRCCRRICPGVINTNVCPGIIAAEVSSEMNLRFVSRHKVAKDRHRDLAQWYRG